MWKKLAIGAAIVVALILLTVVGYYRSVIGSYRVELVSAGQVVGSGEFTIALESFAWTRVEFPGHYSARGWLEMEQPVCDFLKRTVDAELPRGARIACDDFYVRPEGLAMIQLSASRGSHLILMVFDDIGGGTSVGRFGYFQHEHQDIFCECRVTRK